MIKEAGIVEYQISVSKIEDLKFMINRVKAGNTPPDSDKIINLNEVTTVFYLYLFMNGIALLVLGVEMLVKKIKWNKFKFKR